MGKRLAPVILTGLILVIQGQLWFGRGSLPKVAQLRAQLEEQHQMNAQARLANLQLEAEVRDLKEGLEMVEELARMELGMVQANEIYVQITR